MKHTQQHLISSIAITAVFNTVIALIMHFMIIRDQGFGSIFAISQFTGLSICLFVHLGMWVSEYKLKGWMAPCIAAGLICGILTGGVLSWAVLWISRGFGLFLYLRHVFLYIVVFGVVFGVPIIYFFTAREKLAESEKKIQEEKIRRLTMEKEAAMTSLRLLQAQIEPHFLFNTLANVIMLFDTDVDKARKMLIDVNEYLRISLDRTRQEMITLTQELDLVRQYLEIFKIRMGKRLCFSINDRTGLADFLFPPLTIQPLVENAVKHGLETKVDGGSITIDCRCEDQWVVIEVADTGSGLMENESAGGIGIDNVSRRLSRIYGDNACLSLTPNTPCGLKVVIKVAK
jgi:sensor histidine kinase YesM